MPDPGDFTRLERKGDLANGITYERIYKDGSKVVFDAAGFMIRAEDRHGNATHYEYNGDGTLARTEKEVAGDPRLVTELTYIEARLPASPCRPPGNPRLKRR